MGTCKCGRYEYISMKSLLQSYSKMASWLTEHNRLLKPFCYSHGQKRNDNENTPISLSDTLYNIITNNTTKQHKGRYNVKKFSLFTLNRWTKRCTEWQPRRGKRSRGRPSRRWQDDITEKEGTTWIRKVTDRRRWKTLMEGYILQWMDKAYMRWDERMEI